MVAFLFYRLELKWILGFLGFILIQSSVLANISVSAFLDPATLHQGWPLKGTLEVTHNSDQKVEESSALLNDRFLKIDLLRSVRISPDSPLTVSIYQFTLPPQNQGTYTLSSLSLKVDGKTFKTLPITYEIQAPLASPLVSSDENLKSTLQLQAYSEGLKELYPGQETKLVYRYIYKGNIALLKEVLPMLEAEGLQKVGRPDIRTWTEKDLSFFEISQQVQAVKPGDYAWGPSRIEGVVYVEDARGNKQFTATHLSSQAPIVKLIVKPFPLEDQPASFNGAFGEFTMDINLLSVATLNEGDPVFVRVSIKGKTSNWDSVSLPEICCQPGFSGLFKENDLPAVGRKEDDSKYFEIKLYPLSAEIKSLPSIQFSYFDPKSEQYKILHSPPIALTISPSRNILPTDRVSSPPINFQSQETLAEWIKSYQPLPPLAFYAMRSLEPADLKNKILGSWWVIGLIPLSLGVVGLQYKLQISWKIQGRKVKKKTSLCIYKEMLKAPQNSPLFFELLHRLLIQQLFECGLINHQEALGVDLPLEGVAGEVRALLLSIDFQRYSGAGSDEKLYFQALEECQRLYKKLQEIKYG
ncbi:BatD family protein [Neochlamydia sp. EPS4]|uniref:BatD family protein n=1 Tax=Neochlamydia sp. EPS4 TaxID=1478175 RepID=UPI0005D10FB1|nr:BatD family protein [Neochlamydia sp. EPS4]